MNTLSKGFTTPHFAIALLARLLYANAMKIAILKERHAQEARCAASPDSVKKLCALGAEIAIEKGAGLASGISDEAFTSAGAKMVTAKQALEKADLLLCVQAPDTKELQLLPENAMVLGMLAPLSPEGDVERYQERKLTSFALELLPRISRAQAMDVLSSQSNLAGYRAVIDGVSYLGKATPMMMTAAGTVPPARVLVLGAGVAGLQAIATAKRLGAVVSAFDVRPAVKEQVESLGAKFIEVAGGEETSGGYAKEMSEEYKQKQSALIHETLKTQDLCISTALIPGKEAPELITPAMLADMKAGSVIVDLAVASGGNCRASKPDEVIDHQGVILVGYTNMPSRVAADATPLYARNLYHFIADLMVNKESKSLQIKWEDELIRGTLVTKDGELQNDMVKTALSAAKTSSKPAAKKAKSPKVSAEAAEGEMEAAHE